MRSKLVKIKRSILVNFILTLSINCDTSGKKIAVARAFMKESSILVLDEPTASMDALAELEIFQTFDKLKKINCVYL